MLGKLLKHEFRATARIMGPLYLALMILAVSANGSARILESSQNRFLSVLSGLILFLFCLAIIALGVMTLVVMVNQFGKNLLGDEGYVTLTLPASVHEQVWSKLIVSTVWALISGLAIFLAAIIAIFRVSYINDFINTIQRIINQFTGYYALNGTALLLEFLVLVIVSYLALCLQFYASMAVGHSFANYKRSLSVLFFFVFLIVLQIFETFGLFSVKDVNWGNLSLQANGLKGTYLFLGISIIYSVVIGAIFYFITTYMLKKHLNLE